MKLTFNTTAMISTALLAASGLALASGKVHWGYDGEEGPTHWGSLSPEFALCASGKNQSPVNLTDMVEGELPALKLAYQPGGREIVNNGHTIKVNYAPGSELRLGEHAFALKQFHFHSPSENTVEGHSFPMEAHFVHADPDGNLAVLALMIEIGEENEELAKGWAQMPAKPGAESLQAPMDANALLPESLDYYRFNGSLTTPPCSEGVNWFVLKAPITASEEQIHQFAEIMGHANNRPVQPANARVIIQ